jgi:DNA repair protein RecO (recombination protein O)
VPWQRTEDGLKLRGSALMALAQDREPASAEDMASLRRLLRALIARHLDGTELRAWNLFGGLRGVTSAAPSP